MKRIALLLALATTLHYASAQTPAKPATTAAKPATAATAAKKPGTTTASGIKLPPGVTPVRGILKTAFALKYQEVKIGTGAPAEAGKLYKVHYTGWLASDGKKFDSSFDHRRPVLDKDGKPENDADGKPKLGDPEPIQFPQGRRGVIPGWDQGFEGMKVGGKRRLFIPYQLAYGELGRPPVIPPKADLIFDIELVDVTDMPAQRGPGGPGAPGARPMPLRPGAAPAPGTPVPPTGANPSAPTAPPAPAAKPADPTAPTVAPNSAPPASAPAPTTPPPTSPTAPPAKPANPAQPQ
jgi:peptidylprolyl isomerase